MKRILRSFVTVLCIGIVLFLNFIGLGNPAYVSAFLTEKKQNGISGMSHDRLDTDDSIVYAHGTTLKENGEFLFSYRGKTYLNEYERLIAEDGMMFGTDWDWFGSYANGGTVLGDDHVNGNDCAYDEEYVERSLYNMKTIGINCVNVWIGPGSCFTFDDDANVSGLDSKFQENIIKLLDSFRKVGIDILPTICTHGIGGLNNDKIVNGLSNSEREIMYQRFYYDEVARKAFIENGIRPMLRYLKDYQDVIPVISVGTEQGGALNDLDTGILFEVGQFDWESYATHLNTLIREIKSMMPNMLTSVEDIGRVDAYVKYNDIPLDLFGLNRYTMEGVPKVNNYMLVKPCYISEFNCGYSYDLMNLYTEEQRNTVRSKMYEDAYQKGYMGLFFFMWSENPAGLMSVFFNGATNDEYSQFRHFIVPASYNIHDIIHDHRGEDTADVPALFYNNGSKINYWIGSREAVCYTIERREQGSEWVVLATGIDPHSHMLDNGIYYYEDASMAAGKTYEYRVTSVFENGERISSQPGNPCDLFTPDEMFVDDSGEYAGGFENFSIDGDSGGSNSNGWYKVAISGDIGEVVDDPMTAHTGACYLLADSTMGKGEAGYNSAWWQYNLALKPNTKYTLTFYAKQVEGTTDVMVKDRATDLGHGQWKAVTGNENDQNVWNLNKIDFVSPEDGEVYILLKAGNGDIRKCCLDSFSVKERR